MFSCQVKDIFDPATLQKCSVHSYTCTEGVYGTYFLHVEGTVQYASYAHGRESITWL